MQIPTQTSQFSIHAVFLIIILTILGGTFVQCKQEELIKSVSIEKNRVSFHVASSLKKYIQEDLFVEYEDPIDLRQLEYEIITMPLIMNVIPIIWITGQTLTIDSMDKELYYSLTLLKKLFYILYPNTRWDGELKPRRLKDLKSTHERMQRSTKKAVLFSGGLDSTSSFFWHVNDDIETITAWGAYDLPLKQGHIWKNRKKKISDFVSSYGHKSNFLRSNYYDFLNLPLLNSISDDLYSWRLCCVEAIGWAGLTAPLLISKGCSTLLTPSSGHWDYPWPDSTNPFVEMSIRFAGCKIETDQYDLSRFGKNQCIVNACLTNGYKKPYIKVCQWTQEEDDINCCKCRKCLTSIIGFLALEEDPHEYGFPVKPETAVSYALEFLSQKEGCGHFDMDNFLIIQQYLLSERNQEKHRYAKELAPFISYDFKSVVLNDKDDIVPFTWEQLAPLVPRVKFPEEYRRNIFEPLKPCLNLAKSEESSTFFWKNLDWLTFNFF